MEVPEKSRPLVIVIIRKGESIHGKLSASREMKNEDEVIGSIRNMSTVDVVGVNWSEYTFEEQLYLVRNASVIIGMHGAGITVSQRLHHSEFEILTD